MQQVIYKHIKMNLHILVHTTYKYYYFHDSVQIVLH